MNESKQKTVFEERDEAIWLMNKTSLELNKVKLQLAATEEALAQVQRESAELRAKYETHCGYWDGPLMKIARAAVASRIAGNAHCYINGIEPRDYDALAELAVAQDEAESAFNDALIEYRSLTEYGALHSYALSPPKQAAVDRGIERAEKVEEMWERN